MGSDVYRFGFPYDVDFWIPKRSYPQSLVEVFLLVGFIQEVGEIHAGPGEFHTGKGPFTGEVHTGNWRGSCRAS